MTVKQSKILEIAMKQSAIDYGFEIESLLKEET